MNIRHSANFLCFGAPRPAAKSAITPGWAFRRTDGPTLLLIKRRFSQISIIFESVAGGKTLPRPHNSYFSSKTSSLTHRSSITLPAKWYPWLWCEHEYDPLERCCWMMSQKWVLGRCYSFHISPKSSLGKHNSIKRFDAGLFKCRRLP